MSGKRAVVVGGGVIGAASAYNLALRGWETTLIEQGDFGGGCSHGNCGYVSPSHVLPLAAPGVLWPTLRTMFRRNSPLKIRLRFDPALWSWLAKFATKCNRRDMLAAGEGINALLQSSRRLYDDLFAAENFDCEWETRGLIFVLHSLAGMEHHAEVDKLLRERYGVGATRLSGDELVAREPALKPGLGGGWLYECDAHLRPDRLMASWKRVLGEKGVTIREKCEFREFQKIDSRVSAVETSDGTYQADAVVMAAGAWTPLLARQLKLRVPIVPGKGYSMTMARPKLCPTYPMIFEEHRVAMTPFSSGYRIGSTMEFGGYDRSLNRERLGLLRNGADLYLHEPFGEPVVEEWWGWRPMIYDGLPVIDFAPAFDNVLIAAGHCMLGLSMATGTGRLVGELLDRAAPHIDPKPYSARRF